MLKSEGIHDKIIWKCSIFVIIALVAQWIEQCPPKACFA